MTTFSSSFFRHNRRQLQKLLPQDQLIVLTAHGVLQRSADTTFPFAQDKNFWYLTGTNEPDIVLVMDGSDEYLIVPPVDAVRDVFDGALDQNALTAISGISTVLPSAEGWSRLKAALVNRTDVYTVMPAPVYQPHYAFYVNPARRRLAERLRRLKAGLQWHDIRPELTKLRSVKQQPEIETITQAVKITTETFDQLRRAASLKQFAHEYELEAAITAAFRQRGAAGHAYSPIVASGVHGTTLHYIANDGPLEPGKLLVVDAGAEVGQYAADITRTLSTQPLTSRQAAVYSAVRDVQQYALSLLKPGVLLRECEKQVVAQMGQALKQLRLIDDARDHDAIRRYYPHATSHFMGLDVHDVGDYRQPLASGMVLTCEPGIYIPEEGIGLRLEDDVLITNSGSQNLSGSCSYDPYIV